MSIYLRKRLMNLLRSKMEGLGPREHRESTPEDASTFEEEPATAPRGDSELARHLEALELDSAPDFETVKQAYKRQSRAYHPDRFGGDPEKGRIATEVQQRLNEALAYFKKHFRESGR